VTSGATRIWCQGTRRSRLWKREHQGTKGAKWGRVWGGVSAPQPTRGSGGASWAPQRDPGRSKLQLLEKLHYPLWKIGGDSHHHFQKWWWLSPSTHIQSCAYGIWRLTLRFHFLWIAINKSIKKSDHGEIGKWITIVRYPLSLHNNKQLWTSYSSSSWCGLSGAGCCRSHKHDPGLTILCLTIGGFKTNVEWCQIELNSPEPSLMRSARSAIPVPRQSGHTSPRTRLWSTDRSTRAMWLKNLRPLAHQMQITT